jgi:D-alanyl-D-alanine carboxypeptidase
MKTPARHTLIIIIALVISLGALGYGGYKYRSLHLAFENAQRDYAAHTADFQKSIADREHDNQDLSDALDRANAENQNFEDQIRNITGTVGTLTKLSQTDPQLLQKYSKVYFLNENYVPAELGSIPKEDLSDQSRTIQFHANALPYLERLIAAAKDDGITLQIVSGYRSFAEQKRLKSGYQVTYGKGANSFSADQGYSEHQLGTAVDFTTPEIGGGLTGFDKTKAYTWLTNNAYRYGFTLSYPKGNSYYQFEPWHWRFVGVDLAQNLHDNDLHFYDMDQRQIDTYLVKLFD